MNTLRLWAQPWPKTSTYVVAVSGGVDSVVLLDVLAKAQLGKLVVAHVHHGIRAESDEEYAFVQALATQYGAEFEGAHLKLGAGASEQLAREERYVFLRTVAKKCQGTLVVAHHADDVIETIALQCERGTGWRGLAAMGAEDIWRPLTWQYKADILAYAQAHQLEWREDASNHQAVYTRNRLRPLVAALTLDTKQSLLALWHAQMLLARRIESELTPLTTRKRYFYSMTPTTAASEVLRATLKQLGVACTRPQLQALLLAIKTAKPGTRHSLGANCFLAFSKTEFTLIKTKK